MTESDTPRHARPTVRVESVDQHTDNRGSVFEPIDPEALSHQRNCHVVVTEPGAVRGNHVHRESTEILVVRGPARVRYRAPDADGTGHTDHDVMAEAGAVVSFTVPPGIPHAVENTGTEPMLLVAFRDRVHDQDDPDVERVELI